jgi:glycosyltransferase involved in cell wall biosynthesis
MMTLRVLQRRQRRCPDRHLVACPRPDRPAQQLALALVEADVLAGYVTGFVWPKFLPDQAISRVLSKLAGKPLSTGITDRKLEALPRQLVHSIPWIDLGRSTASALGWESAADYCWEFEDLLFARTVCRLLPACTTVHGFEHSSLEFFQAARREGRPAILHITSVHPTFQDRMFEEQYGRYPELCDTNEWTLRRRRHHRDARRIVELELADLIVTCSSFAKRSLVEEGIAPSRVVSIPLGAPPAPAVPRAVSDGRMGKPFTALFAGIVGVRKGCHLLLEAWKQARLADARLLLVGRNNLLRRLTSGEGVEAVGSVSQPHLFQLMEESDVLVFPTLMDSFGLVVNEALAHGLPVITTTNAGSADLIQEGVNGWVLQAGDVAALAERLVWCREHRAELHAMRTRARQSTRSYTWIEYRQRLREVLTERGFLRAPAAAK